MATSGRLRMVCLRSLEGRKLPSIRNTNSNFYWPENQGVPPSESLRISQNGVLEKLGQNTPYSLGVALFVATRKDSRALTGWRFVQALLEPPYGLLLNFWPQGHIRMSRSVILMDIIKAKNITLKGPIISISTTFRRFHIRLGEINHLKVYRVPSLFEEIGIELHCGRTFLISERISGFFDLAKILRVEEFFGPFWYRDAEDGRQLEQNFDLAAVFRKP